MLHHVWRPAAALAGLAFAAGLAFGGPAQAESVQKECSVKYQAAKASNSLNGETWNQFYKQCAAELKGGGSAAAPAPAPTSAPASAPPPATTTTQAAPPSKKHHWWQGGGSNGQAAGTPYTAPPVSAGNVVFPRAVSSQYSNLKPGRARMETCVEQYRANKANGGNGGLKWIEKGGGYWSECNKRLKGV